MQNKKNLTGGLYIWRPNHCHPGKAPISINKTKTMLNTIYRGTIAKTETWMYYSCVTIIDKLTGQNIACKQALQLGESREVTGEKYTKEDASTKRAKERDSLQRSQINFHFHLGNHRKPQSVKTVTGNNNNVSAVCQLPHWAKPNAPVTLALSVPGAENITISHKSKTTKRRQLVWTF